MSIKLTYVVLLLLIAYGLGWWSAGNSASVASSLETFRQYAVKRVSGQPSCPDGYVCERGGK